MDKLELLPEGFPKPQQFMSSEDYRVFIRGMREEVKPYLDKQREARARSEEAARHNRVCA